MTTTASIPQNAAVWFEIPAQDISRQQAFYEALLGRPMHAEAMGPAQGAVFTYNKAQQGTGGALYANPTTASTATGGTGTVVYLDASPSLDAALERATAHGGQVVLPKQTLPKGLGDIAHITDPEGNRVGLHVPA